MLSDTTILVALGGNALAPSAALGTVTEQFAQTRAAMDLIMPFIRQGYRLAITHGNGPQVGDELLRVELAADRVPPLPLGLCVAATQGTMGYMIEQSLQNALLDEDIHRDVVSLITQVLVDEHDPALERPDKFIGERYSRDKARQFADRYGWRIAEQEAGVWRRVVPSPRPVRINNARSIKHLVGMGSIVIASGGGGIPAYVMANGHFEGVDAVIDKDLAAAILGADIGAQEMYILTDVPEVYLDFRTDHQRPLRRMTVAEAQAHLDAGQFPTGSMGPKMEAAIQFIRQGGRKVVLTNTESIAKALVGESGTSVYD
ncbi:MAG: carbamate kinase [Candidatus Marinimicrobia bacterium]|nr:carbamate kinase [Candidatus Neomarinimicrobiota bacterium]